MQFIELHTKAEVDEVINWHNRNSEYVVLDVETTGLNSFTDSIISIQLSGKRADAVYYIHGKDVLCLQSLKSPIVAHNFKFDFTMLFRAGVDLRHAGLHADTFLLDHLLDENQKHSLDEICKRRFHTDYKEQFWSKHKTFQEARHSERIDYACKDIYYTNKLFVELKKELKDKVPISLVRHIHDLALALYTTEITGIKLDIPYTVGLGEVITKKINSIKTSMRSKVDLHCESLENEDYLIELDKRKTDKGRAGVKRGVFNFDSPIQLNRLLYQSLNLPPQYSKTKSLTVDDAALEKLENKHPIVPLMREYRGHRKTLTSFIEGSLEKCVVDRIYPSFNVNGTVTGRISSSEPNMQQLPKEGGIRGIFIPDPGYSFITCDYRQLEVTLAAHFSRDSNLLRIVFEGISQHDITAQGLNIPRNTAKTINFALQYGAGVHKIQQILGVSYREAESALNKYWETYSGLRDFVKDCHRAVAEGRPLVNPFGRHRHFPKTFETKWEKERAERQAANSIIQGTGADITNRAFYLIDKELQKRGIGKALFPIHDEVLISVKDSDTECAKDILSSIMIDVGKEINLSVPLSVECSEASKRWQKN